MMRRPARHFVLPICLVLVAACSPVRYQGNLNRAILNQNDPELVRAGAPAYLLLADSLIEGEPDDVQMLRSGAKLYATYASIFANEPQRRRLLTEKARQYAVRALCEEAPRACRFESLPYEQFVEHLQQLDEDEVDTLYVFSLSWLAWLEAHADELSALAQVPKLEAALKRVAAIDSGYDGGGVQMYLGIINALRPPSLGGRPDVARAHFEQALELSGGRNLGIKVAYARTYARLLYKRDLHDRLLNEVLEAPTEAPGLTLINTLAKREARTLLRSADEYF